MYSGLSSLLKSPQEADREGLQQTGQSTVHGRGFTQQAPTLNLRKPDGKAMNID